MIKRKVAACSNCRQVECKSDEVDVFTAHRAIAAIFMIELIFCVVLVLSASALCSTTEAALFSAPIHRVRQLAQQNANARVLLGIRGQMHRAIATLVILNNIANIVGSILVANLAERALGSQWLGIFSGVLTFAIILFGEMFPKLLGERFALPLSLFAARPIVLLTLALTPLVWILDQLTAPLTRKGHQPTTDEAEIRLLADIGQQEGIIEQAEAKMIEQVFHLNDLSAGDVLTPRVMLTTLSGHSTLAEAQPTILASQHTRMLVVGRAIDEVIGVARKDVLLAALVEGRGDRTVASVSRPALLVPETIAADRLLHRFQAARDHLAVVIDEFGGVVGVVTLEDVLEVLTGEIVDETDRAADLRAVARSRYQRRS